MHPNQTLAIKSQHMEFLFPVYILVHEISPETNKYRRQSHLSNLKSIKKIKQNDKGQCNATGNTQNQSLKRVFITRTMDSSNKYL